jgi:hypothetical protein
MRNLTVWVNCSAKHGVINIQKLKQTLSYSCYVSLTCASTGRGRPISLLLCNFIPAIMSYTSGSDIPVPTL